MLTQKENKKFGINDIKKIKVVLASPERIVNDWSYGEVTKAETVNYRTFKPEDGGLFCEKIFGTTKDWECKCGKYKSRVFEGITCDKCGVTVTHSRVRRERIGHIKLAVPVAHIWFYRVNPCRIGLILGLSSNEVKDILFYEKYIVINKGDSDLKEREVLTEEQLEEVKERYDDFKIGTGAEALREILKQMDLEKELERVKAKIQERINKGKEPNPKDLKRLELINDFIKSGNRPEWMILTHLPVIPPELRPMVQLEGGRFATSDLNDIYRRVINRNNRLNKLKSKNAPDIILKNEKRMLQEAVDALLDNTRSKKTIKVNNNRPLKSLSDLFKGKQGRFRQNLLGKRVDYSGRSVIVIGPRLKMYQCGIPKDMAVELFKPFIIRELKNRGLATHVKEARELIERKDQKIWDILEEVIQDHPVLLNRAPTLHRLGIQAFLPVIVEGKAIQLHPLVCHAFNADFDGDQMAVHVPLSARAQLESWMLMLSSHNILNPANGQPIVFPTQDMVLGLYFLTSKLEGDVGEGKSFSSLEEILYAVDKKVVGLRAEIRVLIDDKIIRTTPGRVIFNSILPKGYPFVNNPITDKEAIRIIADVYSNYSALDTVEMLEKFKELGFYYSTRFAPSISISDIKVPKKSMN
jgi:DNA-directed RNA polymerase subunit beta'